MRHRSITEEPPLMTPSESEEPQNRGGEDCMESREPRSHRPQIHRRRRTGGRTEEDGGWTDD